ncbi:putative reverse transcriptase domain, reverse transcriptase zinc-binding domain protein [Tanacetum coccineum]
MEISGSVGNNIDPRVYVVDGRPLKSILKKPKESSNVPGTAADPNQSGWFEATIEPKGVKGSTKERVANHDIVLPKSAIDSVSNRYANSLVGCFVGKSIAFPIVQNYVTNTWGQFGLQNVMKSDNGVFLFMFASKVGLEKEVTKVLVWIKLCKIPLVAYSEDGLSLIATQVGKPIMLEAFTSYMCNDPWGRISYALALVEISAGTDLKMEVSMAVSNEDGEGYTREVISVEYEWKPPYCRDCKVFGHSHDTCPKNVSISDPNATTKADHSDGFTEVKRKKNKGRKVDQQPKARNIQFNKPQLKDYQPKQASQAAQGKSDSLKPTLNPFDALNTLSEEDISGSQKPISCKGVKDPNIGVSSRVKKKNLVFFPQPKIHYFDKDDTDDANMDVGAKCGAFSSTDTQNEDLESDEEVDEHIFPEGDKFDIRLKVRSSQ